ncbi:hypothetical protein [Nocardioides sp.]|uniref:hypothetical protein n=1 Tax=Nocardioides sp. TaxID=35761 RepID=UPI0027375B0D|nr:hypothetical protein [Nocardioides sp.]MDP3891935.1 hypothetical protein [Nocardioides sp.]
MRARWSKIPPEKRRKRSREAMMKWRQYPENRAKIAARVRILGLEVLSHYGGICVCCGESRYEFLSMDHPNNDGAQHRRDITGPNFRRWLKRNNFPPGFRVLCINCNFSRGRYGYCPHEKEKDRLES